MDDGCRAEFRAGKDGGGIGTGGAIAIGAVAGAAILGAILSNKSDDHKDEAIGAPDWARGRFGGFGPKLETEFDITVASDGRVSGTSDGKDVKGHVTNRNRLHLGGLEFEIAREARGFSAKQRDDSDNVIYFRRR